MTLPASTCAFTSVQIRAIKTLHIALEHCGRLWIPETKDWRLNERHYGGLTGLNKAETAEKHGEEQVHTWRRSFDVPPPEMDAGSEYDPGADPRYAGIAVPRTESLKLTIERVLPYWESDILPVLASGETVIVSAHGNSLRALVKHLDGISDEDIVELNIPTGIPLMYELDEHFRPTEAAWENGARWYRCDAISGGEARTSSSDAGFDLPIARALDSMRSVTRVSIMRLTVSCTRRRPVKPGNSLSTVAWWRLNIAISHNCSNAISPERNPSSTSWLL